MTDRLMKIVTTEITTNKMKKENTISLAETVQLGFLLEGGAVKSMFL